MTGAEELRKIRARLNLKQPEMAARFGMSVRTYIRREQGEIAVKAGELELARRWLAEAEAPKRKKRGA